VVVGTSFEIHAGVAVESPQVLPIHVGHPATETDEAIEMLRLVLLTLGASPCSVVRAPHVQNEQLLPTPRSPVHLLSGALSPTIRTFESIKYLGMAEIKKSTGI